MLHCLRYQYTPQAHCVRDNETHTFAQKAPRDDSTPHSIHPTTYPDQTLYLATLRFQVLFLVLFVPMKR